MTMGNAVRLAKNNTEKSDSSRAFNVPWTGKLNATMKHATISGKKIQPSDKIEKPQIWNTGASVNISNVPHNLTETSELRLHCNSAPNQKLPIKKLETNHFTEDAEHKSKSNMAEGERTEKSDLEKLQERVNLQTNSVSSTPNSPRAEVRYIVLQPGQKLTDLNLLPLRANQEIGQGTIQSQVLYLNQLGKNHPMTVLPGSPSALPISKVLGEIKSSPVSGLVGSSPMLLPSLRVTEPMKSSPVPKDRAKDVVPGTEDKYRTPGSSFLNKSGNIKRPMNAFMVWARSYRSHLASRYQGDTNSQISIKLGDIWNSLSHQEKQPYYEEAERIKNQHKKEFPGWVYRPTPSRRRQDESATHQLLWARFNDGSSSAALAAIATAAANQAPLDSVQVKQEILQPSPGKQEQTPGQDNEKEKQGAEQTTVATGSGEQTTPQTSDGKEQKQGDSSTYSYVTFDVQHQQPPKPATLKVLKAKLCGQSLQGPDCRKVVSTEKAAVNNSKRKSPTKTPRNSSKPHLPTEQKKSGERGPRIMGKKKKQTQRTTARGIERREEDKHMLYLRSTSPVTPPSTPRSVGCLDSPNQRREQTTEGNSSEDTIASDFRDKRSEFTVNGTAIRGEKRSDVPDWSNTNTASDDNWGFPFPPHHYGPFDHLSPRDVPSDEILGPGRRTRGSVEDLTRPEKVTSDLYLDLHRWNSFLTSSESVSKLTDDDFCNIFNPKHCEHGPDCQVCSSDLDLAPKPLQQTLVTRKDLIESAYGDPNVCLEVEVTTEPCKKVDTEVDKITANVYQALLGLDDSRRTGDLERRPSPCGSRGSMYANCNDDNFDTEDNGHQSPGNQISEPVARKHGSKDTIADESLFSSLGAEVCTGDDNGSVSDENETKGVRFVDVNLSAAKTTHVMFKGDSRVSYELNGLESSKSSSTDCNDYKHTCIGCSMNIHDLQALAKAGAEMDQITVSSVGDTDASSGESAEPFLRHVKIESGAPSVTKPASAHMYRTDDTAGETSSRDQSSSELAPEVIPLTPRRSLDSESEKRCEMYHRKIKLQTDISKYKLFDTNTSAKPGRSARLKSAQLTRDGQSMKLGVFEEERNRKGSSLSTGNMGVRCRLDIDDLDGVEGTGMNMATREDNMKATRTSGHNRKVAFAVDDGRKTRCKKKTLKKSMVRDPEEAESELCQGDSAASKSGVTSPHSAQMELLRTLLGREKGMESSMGGECFDLSQHATLSRRQARSQITSKIYVSRQTLPELSRKKTLARSSRNKPR